MGRSCIGLIAGTFTGVAEGVFYAANLKKGVIINATDTVCASRQASQCRCPETRLICIQTPTMRFNGGCVIQ
jgi:hypothetical protein